LRASVTSIVALDQRQALRIGARCAATGVTDVIDVSVALCARDRGHAVVTSDPGDIRAADPALTVLSPAWQTRPTGASAGGSARDLV
jgi:predicted nucleic acid-binding protein